MISKVNAINLMYNACRELSKTSLGDSIVPNIMEDTGLFLDRCDKQIKNALVYRNDFSFCGESFYLEWDTSKLLHRADEYETMPVAVDTLFRTIDYDAVRWEQIDPKIIPSKPVIAAEIPFSKEPVCLIDGNHRICAAHMRNQISISTIALSSDMHLPYLTESSALLYKFCCNVFYASLYASQNISRERALSLIYPLR